MSPNASAPRWFHPGSLFFLASGHRVALARLDRPENVLKCLFQRDIDVGQAYGMAQIDQGSHPKAGIGDPAGHDRREMAELRLDIDGDAMERYPAPQPHADRGDLVLKAIALVRPLHPDAYSVLASLAAHVEGGQRPDDPFFQRRDISADIRAPALQIEHDIGHALAGPVVGQLAA